MHTQAAIPKPALWLGLAGLTPFVGLSTQIGLGWPLSPRLNGPALYLLTAYAALILSFLGGIQWGLAAANATAHDGWRRYGISVVPSLAAWLALWLGSGFILGARGVLLVLVASLALQLAYDLWAVRQGEAPEWLGRLRILLTGVAAASLLCAAAFGPF